MVMISAAVLLSVFTINTSQAQGRVSLQVFYDELDPYGTWMEHRTYGYVWIPSVDLALFLIQLMDTGYKLNMVIHGFQIIPGAGLLFIMVVGSMMTSMDGSGCLTLSGHLHG
jgi:hypothetical protein